MYNPRNCGICGRLTTRGTLSDTTITTLYSPSVIFLARENIPSLTGQTIGTTRVFVRMMIVFGVSICIILSRSLRKSCFVHYLLSSLLRAKSPVAQSFSKNE
jgi:hypothetical protein